MASELKVDKIFNAGGDQDSGINLATNDTIKFDIATSTKATMASTGIVTIVGEGGSTTTNLQQGLCKVWEQSVGAGTGFDDSFNAASLTDSSTGVEEINYTSNMANNDAALTMSHQYTTASGTGSFFDNASNRTTALHRVNHYQNGSSADPVKYNSTIHGDLA